MNHSLIDVLNEHICNKREHFINKLIKNNFFIEMAVTSASKRTNIGRC